MGTGFLNEHKVVTTDDRFSNMYSVYLVTQYKKQAQ